MPSIHLLGKSVAELIAAGEVIERPSSIIKELLENSIDAGATSITIEIRRGGKTFLRVTDNGCGISRQDVPKAFFRHATSKIQTQNDLEKIGTLGFRGEALASICAVSKVELQTRQAEDLYGTSYCIEGGEEKSLDECGCSQGTTIVVRDLFYNVPARLKFLKKDITEGNAIQSVVDKIALSHPEISIKFVREGRQVLHTPGNGDLYSVIYAVFGKEFAATLMPVSSKDGLVSGFSSVPMQSRANRSMQHFFINGRYVKSKTCITALEEAYKGSIMVGKFPACVLNLSVPLDQVDVNVHPAKIEVRFTDERAVFEQVYFAVKQALANQNQLKQEQLDVKKHVDRVVFHPEKHAQTKLERTTESSFPQKASHFQLRDGGFRYNTDSAKINTMEYHFLDDSKLKQTQVSSPKKNTQKENPLESRIILEETNTKEIDQEIGQKVEITQEKEHVNSVETEKPPVRIIGELFKTYILAESEDLFIVVDKHAAHERILYEQLKQQQSNLESQILLLPKSLTLSKEEKETALAGQAEFKRFGFELDDFGENSVLIRAIPIVLDQCDFVDVFYDILNNLMKHKMDITPKELDELYHSMACKAAIKANDINGAQELEQLFYRVYQDDAIRYCPHGRPVVLTYTKGRFERQFGRS